jgi:hypothetical protein
MPYYPKPTVTDTLNKRRIICRLQGGQYEIWRI